MDSTIKSTLIFHCWPATDSSLASPRVTGLCPPLIKVIVFKSVGFFVLVGCFFLLSCSRKTICQNQIMTPTISSHGQHPERNVPQGSFHSTQLREWALPHTSLVLVEYHSKSVTLSKKEMQNGSSLHSSVNVMVLFRSSHLVQRAVLSSMDFAPLLSFSKLLISS